MDSLNTCGNGQWQRENVALVYSNTNRTLCYLNQEDIRAERSGNIRIYESNRERVDRGGSDRSLFRWNEREFSSNPFYISPNCYQYTQGEVEY